MVYGPKRICFVKNAKHKQNIIALVYDFDGTFSPHNVQEDTIFKAYGIDKDKFWAKTKRMVVRRGYEQTLAYLKLLIHEPCFEKRPLTRQGLCALADQIEYFPGVPEFFAVLDRFLKGVPEVSQWGITLEHYIVSRGIKEILEACRIAKYFKKIYACEFDYERGKPVFPKLVINDTNKTQFLFRIKKGKLELNQDINSHTPEEKCRIPFRNMIYLGDGRTDIPSMTVTQKSGGHAIAVFPPGHRVSVTVAEMVREKRADHFAPADFTEGKLLVRIIQSTIKKIVQEIAYHLSSRMSSDWIDRKGPKGRK